MPRQARIAVGDTVYHVINRSNGRIKIFSTEKEYKHFEKLLEEAKELIDMRVLSYCIMPNHWHLVLYPKKDGDMGEFMRWLTTTHVRQRRVATKSIGHGHLYQGAYKSFIVQKDSYLLQLIRYVEQNPLRAKLVAHSEHWQWSSLWRREKGSVKEKKLLADLPIELPKKYLRSVNEILPQEMLGKLRTSVNKGTPYGGDAWIMKTVEKFGLQSTTRGAGRPKI